MLNGKGKTAIITGAASGIGKSIGIKLLENDYKVIFSDINDSALQTLKGELATKNKEFSTFAADVTNEEHIIQLVQFVRDTYGSVDVVVNNAGLQHVDNVEDFPVDTFKRMIDVMLTAPFMIAKHVVPIMKKQNYGRILNLASINGLIGFSGKAAYNSAKHGILGLTKVLALETASYDITINALCPGYVDTPLVRNQLEDLAKTRNVSLENVLEEVIYPLVPKKQLLSVEEVANYVLFLVSEQTKNVTGSAAVIDGGYTAQ